ncbi:alanine racemase, partial [Arthrospira platensis SPKY1]|nr:alanine racemase [Arthrospira platensis SPKY1]
MIFNPDFDFLDEMIKYDLEPVLYSFYQFEIIEQVDSEHLKFHIKLDTGMRRLGFDSSESDVLCQWLKKHRESRVVSVFSHLAASNEADKDDFTRHQVREFEKIYKRIVETINYRPIRHILNSSGIVRFPEYQYDMVRLGSGMHGVDTSQMISEKLEPVHILTTRISQIKILKAG